MAKTVDGFRGVVQFMHPGAEHMLDRSGWTPWNLSMHRRKFMKVTGQSISASGQTDFSDLRLWGEWEGPSRGIKTWDDTSKVLPSHLVVPEYPGSPRLVAGLQNTDPYIFGDTFKYTLCKQVKKNGQSTFLAQLLPGTLILFGSQVRGRFCLDTAFVVSEQIIQHSRDTWQSQLSTCSAVYKSMTLLPMYGDPLIRPDTHFTLYAGASTSGSFNEMYSFVPCIKESDRRERFARPVLEMDGIINHSLMMGQRRTPMTLAEVSRVWSEVVAQVFQHDLLLGVSFQEPQQAVVPDSVWPH